MVYRTGGSIVRRNPLGYLLLSPNSTLFSAYFTWGWYYITRDNFDNAVSGFTARRLTGDICN